MIGTNIVSRITNLLFVLLFCGHWSLTCLYDSEKNVRRQMNSLFMIGMYMCVYIYVTHIDTKHSIYNHLNTEELLNSNHSQYSSILKLLDGNANNRLNFTSSQNLRHFKHFYFISKVDYFPTT